MKKCPHLTRRWARSYPPTPPVIRVVLLHTKPAVQDLYPDFVPLVNELQTITFGLHCDSREVSNLIQETKTGLVKKLSNFLQIKEKILLKMHFSEVQIVTALCNEDPGSA